MWEASLHGRSFQPHTPEFAELHLPAQPAEIRLEESGSRAEVHPKKGVVVVHDAQVTDRLIITHAVGGKNLFYFLTMLDRGRLQTLPVAYDIRRREWFSTTGSAVRHFSSDAMDAPLQWTDRAYTFNTSCYRCHVSQASTNYDIGSDTYELAWAEPGVNCETCHGPAAEHVKVCREAEGKSPPADLKIISTKGFDADQTNALCGSCHAKMSPLTQTFQPGERYFDHFDLATLEDPDFHPDGRDLGENYTYSSWRLSWCVQSGQLDCLHCHTSAGRFLFPDDPNRSCLPCHAERVANVAEHSHHPPESKGSECIQCHMPATEFARMRRSDHSMLPPTPAATISFDSPNACNLCHGDQTAAWANKYARKWYGNNYQKNVLHRSALVAAARKNDWTRLDEMLAYVTSKDRDEVFAASFLRMLRSCDDKRKWPAVIKALGDPSPLVRASAAQAAEGYTGAREHLVDATRDEHRLVRIRAAASLAGAPREPLTIKRQDDLEKATTELKASLLARPDDHASHFNLGNLHFARGEYEMAVRSYRTAMQLEPMDIATLVNASLAYNALGRNVDAEQFLRSALKVDSVSTAANLNLGLLLGETGRLREAEAALRAAFASDSTCASAAYNLSVILASDRIAEALEWSRKALLLRPNERKYVNALAHHLLGTERTDEAMSKLRRIMMESPLQDEAYGILGEVLETQGRESEAMEVYQSALRIGALTPNARLVFERRLRLLKGRRN